MNFFQIKTLLEKGVICHQLELSGLTNFKGVWDWATNEAFSSFLKMAEGVIDSNSGDLLLKLPVFSILWIQLLPDLNFPLMFLPSPWIWGYIVLFILLTSSWGVLSGCKSGVWTPERGSTLIATFLEQESKIITYLIFN